MNLEPEQALIEQVEQDVSTMWQAQGPQIQVCQKILVQSNHTPTNLMFLIHPKRIILDWWMKDWENNLVRQRRRQPYCYRKSPCVKQRPNKSCLVGFYILKYFLFNVRERVWGTKVFSGCCNSNPVQLLLFLCCSLPVNRLQEGHLYLSLAYKKYTFGWYETFPVTK